MHSGITVDAHAQWVEERKAAEVEVGGMMVAARGSVKVRQAVAVWFDLRSSSKAVTHMGHGQVKHSDAASLTRVGTGQ